MGSSKNRLSLIGLYLAECLNWLVHASNYHLVNPIGSEEFLVDIWGPPAYGFIQNITIGTLINSVLGLAAVIVPVLMCKLFLENQELINRSGYFITQKASQIVAGFVGLLYLFVVATEFSVLYLKIQQATNIGPIQIAGAEPTGFIPMLIMCIALILANLGLGLFVAHTHRKIASSEFQSASIGKASDRSHPHK